MSVDQKNPPVFPLFLKGEFSPSEFDPLFEKEGLGEI
jgi:hypothetical protein